MSALLMSRSLEQFPVKTRFVLSWGMLKNWLKQTKWPRLKMFLNELWCIATGKVELVQLLLNVVWWFPRKLKIELPYDSIIPIQGYLPKRTESSNLNRDMYSHIRNIIIHNSQKPEAIQEFINKQINKMWYIHTGITQRYCRISSRPWQYSKSHEFLVSQCIKLMFTLYSSLSSMQ